MVPRHLLLPAAAALAMVALVGFAWLLATGAPLAGLLAPAGVLILALAGAGLGLRASMTPPLIGRSLRLEPDRLRPGRLRDYTLRAIGYHRQFRALGETFPYPPARAAIARDLSTVEATVRAVYDLCLFLQAHELGESHPPALAGKSPAEIDALAAEAETTLTDTLMLISRTYKRLRGAWSTPAALASIDAPFADLPPLTGRLRELTTLFAPTMPPQPAGPRAPA